MFFRYLHRELRHRVRQMVFVSVGLALGIGLVIFVTAVADGVAKAQDTVMRSLYGADTQIAVTAPAPPEGAGNPCHPVTSARCAFQFFAPFHRINDKVKAGALEPQRGTKVNDEGFVVGGSEVSGLLPASSIQKINNLDGVASAVGSLTGTSTRLTGVWGTATEDTWDDAWPVRPYKGGHRGEFSTYESGNWSFEIYSYQVSGVDPKNARRGPYGAVKPAKGRSLRPSDVGADVAVVDTSYAKPRNLSPGSTINVADNKFRVVGITKPPPHITPAAVYIPLDRAQALAVESGNVASKDQVHTIYVKLAPAADTEDVENEIISLLPQANVTSSENLSGQVNGSFASSGLISDLGRWLTIIVLIAAVGLAVLLTLSTVSRRVQEFGTLKALGWRSRRIVGQVLGEAMVKGLAGGVLGIVLGVGAAKVTTALAPPLSTSIGVGPGGGEVVQTADYHLEDLGNLIGASSATSRTVSDVVLSAPVTLGTILLAVALAVASGLIAGAFGGWRTARLRPADALRQVE